MFIVSSCSCDFRGEKRWLTLLLSQSRDRGAFQARDLGSFWLFSILEENFVAATGGMCFSFFFFPPRPGFDTTCRGRHEGGKKKKVGRHSAPRRWTAPTSNQSAFSRQAKVKLGGFATFGHVDANSFMFSIH